MDAKLKEEWERLKKSLSSKNWDAGQEATYFGFFCHGWYGRLNEAAYQVENNSVADNKLKSDNLRGRTNSMNEKTLLGVDCNGTEIYGKLDKISVHTNNHPDFDGTSWGWLEGCSKFVCWSNKSSSRFTKKDADELANKWNNRREK